MDLDKKTLRNIFLGVAACIGLYWLLHETERLMGLLRGIWSLVAPYAVGAVLAFILNVPMRAIERGLGGIKKPGLRRLAAICLTFLAIAVVLIGVVWLLVPQITATVERLIAALPGFFSRIQALVTDYMAEHPEVLDWLSENTDFENFNWSELVQRVVNILTSGVSSIFDMAYNVVIGLYNGIFNAVFSIVFALYCLSRKEILARQCKKLLYSFVPERVSDEIVRIMRMSNTTFSNFLSGQCVEAVILGCMFAITMLILGLPYVPLVSVVIAVTALVPIVGAWVGMIVGFVFIMVESVPQALLFVVVFQVLQQIENNLIYPRVVGTSIGLPGMWVLVAVGIGGDLMGVVGMLLFIPLASVLYALLRELTDKRLAGRRIDPGKLANQAPEQTSRFKGREKKKPPKEKKK